MSKAVERGVVAFSVNVECKLTSMVSKFDLRRSHSKQRENLWRSFYKFRLSELPKLWDNFTTTMKLDKKYKDPWLIQTAARIMTENIIKCKLPTPQSPDDPTVQLNTDEHNALRYAAGYVLYSMKKKYKDKNPILLSWLEKQIDSSVNASTYYQFTKLWVEKVNRGGLYLVSDSLYEVFLAMELVLRQYLRHCPQKHGLNKDQVLEAMQEDNAVQFHWSLMTMDLDDEESDTLLQEMIKLWLTIRGFSYASALVEEYKRSHNEALKRKKALRKELKKTSELKKKSDLESSESSK